MPQWGSTMPCALLSRIAHDANRSKNGGPYRLAGAATNYHQAIEWIQAAALSGDRAYAVEAANTHVAALARHDQSFGEAMAKVRPGLS